MKIMDVESKVVQSTVKVLASTQKVCCENAFIFSEGKRVRVIPVLKLIFY